MSVGGVNDRDQGVGTELALVPHLDDEPGDWFEETAALQTSAVVARDDAGRVEGSVEVELLGSHPLASWAHHAFVDLLISFYHRGEHVVVALDEFYSILCLHLFEVHGESILAARGG